MIQIILLKEVSKRHMNIAQNQLSIVTVPNVLKEELNLFENKLPKKLVLS